MPLRRFLRLLLTGLLALLPEGLAGSALLSPWPSGESHTPPLRVGYQAPFYAPGFSLGHRAAHADGPGDWPMSGHELGSLD